MPIRYQSVVYDAPNFLPTALTELRVAAEGLVELAKAQALQVEKLKRQLAGHQDHRFGSKSGSSNQPNLLLRLEDEETAVAQITQPEEVADPEPKRNPLPPTLPRNEQILSPEDIRKCGGDLRAIGEDDETSSAISPRTSVERGTGIDPRPVCCEQDRPPSDDLQMLRRDRAGRVAIERGRPVAKLLAHVLVYE